MKPEEMARQRIDAMLTAAGWIVQDRRQLNLGAGPGIAIREFSLRAGTADYFLMVNREAVGVVEAKPAGHILQGVREQSAKYLTGTDDDLPVARLPLPFHYEATGHEIRFTSNKQLNFVQHIYSSSSKIARTSARLVLILALVLGRREFNGRISDVIPRVVDADEEE